MGEAEAEIKTYGPEDHPKLRSSLLRQFGTSMGTDLHERERRYDKGMPERGKLAFPEGCDIRAKLG